MLFQSRSLVTAVSLAPKICHNIFAQNSIIILDISQQSIACLAGNNMTFTYKGEEFHAQSRTEQNRTVIQQTPYTTSVN
jgi:hypothetical protein